MGKWEVHRMKRYFSTFLAVIFLISSLGNNVVLAQGILSGSQELTWSLETEQEKEYQSNSDSEDENDQEDSEDSEEDSEEGGEEPEDPGDDEEDPEEPEEDLTTDAAVRGLTVNYDESQDAIILSYRLSGTVSYVNILMDGRPIEEEYSGIYTSYSYDLLEDAEGKEYTFQIVPCEGLLHRCL